MNVLIRLAKRTASHTKAVQDQGSVLGVLQGQVPRYAWARSPEGRHSRTSRFESAYAVRI